jgi:hypothetical protein
VLHFHELAHGFIENSVERVGGELSLCCVAGLDWVAHHLTISADTGQHGLLSYHSDLGLTAGVACRTVQTVYLVVQDAQFSYSLGLMEFSERGGWFMRLDLARYWRCRHGNFYGTDF